MIHHKVLFVLDNSVLFEKVKKPLAGLKTLELDAVFDFDEAERVMNSSETIFNGFFIDPKAFNKKAIDLLKICHFGHNSVPIFFLNENMDDWTTQLSKRPLGIQGMIESIDKLVDIIRNIEKMAFSTQFYNWKESQNKVKKKKSAKQKSSTPSSHAESEQDTDSVYFSIQISNLICGKVCFFNIYIKLSENKYIKLANQGEKIDYKRFENYLKKGVDRLYIKKDQREYFIKQVDKQVKKFLKIDKASKQIKINYILNMGHQVMELVKGFVA